MKRFTFALLAFGLFAPNAQAVVLYEDTFDSYADQAAFQDKWRAIGCSGQGLNPTTQCTLTSNYPSNILSTDFPERGNVLLNHSPVGSPGSVDAGQRNESVDSSNNLIIPTTPLLAPGEKLAFSFDYYDLGNLTPPPGDSPNRQFVTLQFRDAGGTVGTLTNQLIGMGLNNNQTGSASGGNFYMARILGAVTPATDPDGGPAETVTGTSIYFKMNDTSTATNTGPGIRTPGWHNLKVEISQVGGATPVQNYQFFVDNVLAETVNGVASAARQYNLIRIGAGTSSASLDAYYDNFKIEHILAAPPAFNGDFNGDLVVDAADYVIWRDNDGQTGGATKDVGDANGDGNVDSADYGIWKGTFGNTITASGGFLNVGTIPEPTSLVLVLAAAAFIAPRRRR